MSTLPAHAVAYLHVGVVQISIANLIVLIAMIVVFILALVVPFPRGHDRSPEDEHENH